MLVYYLFISIFEEGIKYSMIKINILYSIFAFALFEFILYIYNNLDYEYIVVGRLFAFMVHFLLTLSGVNLFRNKYKAFIFSVAMHTIYNIFCTLGFIIGVYIMVILLFIFGLGKQLEKV